MHFEKYHARKEKKLMFIYKFAKALVIFQLQKTYILTEVRLQKSMHFQKISQIFLQNSF